MRLTPDSDRRRTLAGLCLVVAPLCIAFNDAADAAGVRAASLPFFGFYLVAVIGAALGLAHLLRRSADVAGLIGACSCALGAIAATRMAMVGQLEAAFAAGVPGVPPDAVEVALRESPGLFATVFPPGLFFPFGLLVFAAAFWRARTVGRGLALLLGAAAVAFPVGRAVALGPAVFASDALLVAALAGFGVRVLRDPDFWASGDEPSGAAAAPGAFPISNGVR